jgi:beta-galactosidase
MSGCIDAWRFPKLAAHAIRARWNDAPFTRILGHWTWPGQEGSEKRIGVASNADRVELVLNGTSLGVKTRADATRLGYYVWTVPFAPGTLHAVGNHSSRSNGGAHLDQTIDEVRTAGEPVGIIVETLHKTLPANGTDITLVTATIVDSDGARCPTADTTMTFDVESAASKEDEAPTLFGLYGESKVATYRGRGRIVLRTGRVAGKVRVRAHADGLESGDTAMKVR